MELSRQSKTFSEFFFFTFLKSILNLNICEEKMTLIAYIFPVMAVTADVVPEIPTPKNMVR